MMQNEVMTFGEYLNHLIKEKQITITKLAELTGTKSRNAIDRLLNDSTSIKVIEAFASMLIATDKLELFPQEIDMLEQSVEVSRVGKDRYISRKVLLGALENRKGVYSSFDDKELIEADGRILTQQEYFQANASYINIEILIVGSGFSSFAHNYLRHLKISSTTINIEQIFTLGKDICKDSKIFIAMYQLLNYDNYLSFYLDSEENLIDFAVIRKTSQKEKLSTDLLFSYQENIFLLKDSFENKLYEYYENIFRIMKAQTKPIKFIFSLNNVIDDVIDLCKWHYEMEKADSECLIKHNVCIPALPFNVMLNLLKDSNFLELGENHPVIVAMIQLYSDRINNFFSSDKRKIHIYTKRGMSDFVETGLMSDHFQFFRPFNKTEIKQTLEFLLKQVKKDSNFKMLLLKEDIYLGNIAFSYYKGDALCMYEESSGYGEDYFDITVCAKPFLDLYDDLIENKVLKYLVYPESETIEYLEYLISTLD